MIDDELLELTADCYVALRARGYLKDCPTFESFVARTLGPECLGRPDDPDGFLALPLSAPPVGCSPN